MTTENAESIGYAGCAGTAKIHVHFQDDDGDKRTEPATEFDLWRAGYAKIETVRLHIEADDLEALEDFFCEGPEASE